MGSRRGSFGWCRELVIGTNIQRKRGEVILIHPSAAPTSCIFRPIERVLGSNPAWLYANRRILRHGLSNESSCSLNTLHVRRRCFSNLQTKYPPSSSPSHTTNELIPPLPAIHRIRSLRKVERVSISPYLPKSYIYGTTTFASSFSWGINILLFRVLRTLIRSVLRSPKCPVRNSTSIFFPGCASLNRLASG